MNKLKCYYAHGMLTYNSTIEEQDVKLLNFLGFEVINPNKKETQIACQQYAKVHGKDKIMDYFKLMVDDCDLVAFRGLPDNNLLSGVSIEIQHALDTNKPIIELPCSLTRRMLDYKLTKQYLTEVGYYKMEWYAKDNSRGKN